MSDRAIVAVAGGTGFVGGAIARELARRGHRVIVLSHRGRRPAGSSPIEAGAPGPAPAPAEGAPAFEFRQADVTRPETLTAALSGVETLVVALAFRNSPIESPRRGQTFERVDAAGTEALVAAARAAGSVRRLVYVSGAGASADPAARHWFRAKWRAEEAIRGAGIPFTIFRPSWIYGPGDYALNRFLRMSRRLPFVPQIGNGRQIYAPVFIDDMGRLVADALDPSIGARAVGATLEVGGPDTMTMDDVIRAALRVMGRRRPILHTPVWLMKAVAAPLTLLPSPPLTPDAVDFVVASAPVDTGPLRAALPTPLTPLDEGLATYLGTRS